MGCGGSSEHTKVFFEYTAVVESYKFSTTLRPQLAATRQFAAVHYFAMLDGRSNGKTRPIAVTRRRWRGWQLHVAKQSFE